MKNANTVSAPVNQEAARQTLSPNASRGARSIARPRTASCVLGQRTLNGLSRVLLTALMGVCAALALAQEVIDHGGPIMQAPKVYPIFWLPPGFHFTATNSSGDDFTYEQLILRFFSDVSTGDYLNIVSQYPGE